VEPKPHNPKMQRIFSACGRVLAQTPDLRPR